MIHLGVDIKFQDFLAVMEATANELSSTLQRLAEDKDDPETLTEYLETNTTTFLYLLCIFSKLGGEELDVFQAMKIVHKVVSDIKPKSKRSGKSLIHMAVDSVTPIDDFHTRDVVRFPCAKTTKLLIEAGADVQVMDNDGNTPLHLIVGYQRVVGDFLTLHSVITSLVDAGAHVDVVNANGKTPMAKASTGVAEIILKSQQRLSLKCLSARAVKRHGLSYIGQVPATLEHFISLHGP
jgi:Fem-1 family protein b